MSLLWKPLIDSRFATSSLWGTWCIRDYFYIVLTYPKYHHKNVPWVKWSLNSEILQKRRPKCDSVGFIFGDFWTPRTMKPIHNNTVVRQPKHDFHTTRNKQECLTIENNEWKSQPRACEPCVRAWFGVHITQMWFHFLFISHYLSMYFSPLLFQWFLFSDIIMKLGVVGAALLVAPTPDGLSCWNSCSNCHSKWWKFCEYKIITNIWFSFFAGSVIAAYRRNVLWRRAAQIMFQLVTAKGPCAAFETLKNSAIWVQ